MKPNYQGKFTYSNQSCQPKGDAFVRDSSFDEIEMFVQGMRRSGYLDEDIASILRDQGKEEKHIDQLLQRKP